MKKFEKITLTLCYIFVAVSLFRVSVALVQDLPEFNFISLLYLAVFFLAELSLLFVAGVLLFSKPERNKPERF
jgi:hypothetical protein